MQKTKFSLTAAAAVVVMSGLSSAQADILTGVPMQGGMAMPRSLASIGLATNLASGQTILRFAVTGMTCEGCAGGLRSELQAAPGVKAAEVSLKAAQAVVICDTNRTDAAQLLKVIKEAGFEGKPVSP